MTASHSSSVMLKIMRSRRMPALLTTMSTRPKWSTAVSTIRAPPAMRGHGLVARHGLPARALWISRTTSSAGGRGSAAAVRGAAVVVHDDARRPTPP